MPWCEDCAKYWAPSSMNDDGSCPRCGTSLDEPTGVTASRIPSGPHPAGRDAAADEKTPWHFKLMVVALVAYLGWRFVEIGIEIFT